MVLAGSVVVVVVVAGPVVAVAVAVVVLAGQPVVVVLVGSFPIDTNINLKAFSSRTKDNKSPT